MSDGFWKGVVVAVIAGSILWVGNEGWTTYKRDRAKVVTYEIRDKPVVVNANLRRVISHLDDGKEISFIDIKNDGREDLAPLTIKISDKIGKDGDSILDFGELERFGGYKSEEKLTKINGSIVADFPILRHNEGIRIWVANNGYSIFEVSNDQPGLKLVEDYGLPSFWDSTFLRYIMVGLGTFILGIFASEALNRHVLRRIGFDPDEVSKLYVEEEKRKRGK